MTPPCVCVECCYSVYCTCGLYPAACPRQVRATANTVSDTLSWCLLKWKRWYGSTGPTCSKVPHLLVHFILLLSRVLCDMLQGVVSESEVRGMLVVNELMSQQPSIIQSPHLNVCAVGQSPLGHGW